MDDLISKLRSQASQRVKNNNIKNTHKTAISNNTKHNVINNTEENLVNITQQIVTNDTQENPNFTTEEINNDILNENKEIFEITTSQSEELIHNRFKLDFEYLKEKRTDNFITVSYVKTFEGNKIDNILWGIIKSIEIYKGISSTVYKWEICDETGVIYGSSLVDDTEVTVGSIVCLEDFSLWKIDSNHINIVRRNLKKVIN